MLASSLLYYPRTCWVRLLTHFLNAHVNYKRITALCQNTHSEEQY